MTDKPVKLAFYIYLAVIFTLAVYPLKHPIVSDNDKVNHVLAFAVFMALGTAAHIRLGQLLLSLSGLGYGMLIEGAQHFLPYRSCSLGDLLADAVGMVIGSALVCLAVAAGRRHFPDGRFTEIKLF